MAVSVWFPDRTDRLRTTAKCRVPTEITPQRNAVGKKYMKMQKGLAIFLSPDKNACVSFNRDGIF